MDIIKNDSIDSTQEDCANDDDLNSDQSDALEEIAGNAEDINNFDYGVNSLYEDGSYAFEFDQNSLEAQSYSNGLRISTDYTSSYLVGSRARDGAVVTAALHSIAPHADDRGAETNSLALNVEDPDSSVASNSIDRVQPVMGETIVIGEVVEAEIVADDSTEAWHFAEATAVEPEVILFAVPADTEGPQWFRDKYVKMGVFASFFISAFIILGLAATMLLTTSKVIFEAEPIDPMNSSIICMLTDCASENVTIKISNASKDSLQRIVSEVSKISEEKLILKPDSPQNQAVKRIFQESQSIHVEDSHEDEIIMRYILNVFFFSLGGPNWSSAENWLSNAPLCQWEYIKCNNDLVQEISIVDQNLRGRIPDEVTYSQTIGKAQQ